MSLKPSVCEPVGWFLVRRNRCRMASSVRASGSGLATSVIRWASFLPELIEGDDLGLPFLGRGFTLSGRFRRGRSGDDGRRDLAVGGRRRRRLELQQELHG